MDCFNSYFFLGGHFFIIKCPPGAYYVDFCHYFQHFVENAEKENLDYADFFCWLDKCKVIDGNVKIKDIIDKEEVSDQVKVFMRRAKVSARSPRSDLST